MVAHILTKIWLTISVQSKIEHTLSNPTKRVPTDVFFRDANNFTLQMDNSMHILFGW
jgi:hypothetical protein